MYIVAYPRDDQFLESELVRRAQEMPKFRQLHDLLDAVRKDAVVQLIVRQDLARNWAAKKWGAPALAANVTVCLAVLRRLMNWSYRVAMQEVNGSASWRWVCQLYLQKMPDFRTIQNREAHLKPGTIRRIHQVVVQLGKCLGVTTAQKLRVDGTVTETNIHYPTDSSLLDDAARVLGRLIRQARKSVQPTSAADKAGFRDRHQRAHHLACQLSRLARQKGKNTGKTSQKLYQRLLCVVETLVVQVTQIQPQLAALNDLAAIGLNEEFDVYVPLVRRIIRQTQQRVLKGKTVPASKKVVSLFEPHTAIIRRGKSQPKETEFGRKLWYAEVEGGLISEYRILKGNPQEVQFFLPSLRYHQDQFGAPPRLVSGDRGIYSANNERQARAMGVRRISLPQPGHKSRTRCQHEHQPWFRAAQHFRNGVEGRISQLRRARHLQRCLNHGQPGLERWVGWGVIANNLATIALFLLKHRRALPTC